MTNPTKRFDTDDAASSGDRVSEPSAEAHPSPPVGTPVAETHRAQSASIPPVPGRQQPARSDWAESLAQWLGFGNLKVAIMGAMGSGKTTLLAALGHRLMTREASGSLALFLKEGCTLRTGSEPDSLVIHERSTLETRYLEYAVQATKKAEEQYCSLDFRLRGGALGLSASGSVRYVDSAGENFTNTDVMFSSHWEGFIGSPGVVIFCVPINKILMPYIGGETRTDDLHGAFKASQFLSEFYRKKGKRKVRTVLALTNADQRPAPNSEELRHWAWDDIRDNWISRYAQHFNEWISGSLHTERGVTRYLADAREVSVLAYERIRKKSVHHIRLLNHLDLGMGPPWVVPMSAYGNLASIDLTFQAAMADPHLSIPVPVHVELPILLALCDRWNVLA